MNKSKNVFRKCAYCPHHNQEAKCCCKRTNKSIQNPKKSKSKPHTLINESSIRYHDDTQMKFQQINFSNLIAQNSMLQHQNNNLKNDLLSISHCINEERMSSNKQYVSVPTSHTLKTESEQNLSDRLYISNKNLQQAIIQVDCLSRKNKQLCDKNYILNSELQAVRLENEELKEDITQLKKHMKKCQEKSIQTEINQLKENYKILRQKYQNLKFQNSNLSEQMTKLKYQLNKKKNTVVEENMSPEWIAQTSNKLSFIEQKIDCAENRLKINEPEKQQRNHYDQAQYEPTENSPYFELMHQIKKEIALSINTIHSRTRKFNSVFDTVGNIENTNVKNLICTLIQAFVETCINLNINIEKQLNRKVTVLEKRLQNLLGKLQNFVLEVKNRQLRKRSTSRSRTLINNKSSLNSRSPCALQSNKQNANNFTIIDKSY